MIFAGAIRKLPRFFGNRICYNFAMKTCLKVFPLALLCGCLSSAEMPSVSYWLMEYRPTPMTVTTPKYDIARLSQVIVNLPYAGNRLVVLRKDGTVAFDERNVFASSPAALLKSVFLSGMKASGLFTDVVGATSNVAANLSVEVVVDRLALDCRTEDGRRAFVELHLRLVKGKTLVATVRGEGFADASDGDFGVAFSRAVSAAAASALSKLR